MPAHRAGIFPPVSGSSVIAQRPAEPLHVTIDQFGLGPRPIRPRATMWSNKAYQRLAGRSILTTWVCRASVSSAANPITTPIAPQA